MNHLTLGPLSITLHRTVRVAGANPANLPPSLGRMEIHAVTDHLSRKPAGWPESALFVALQETEAMWMSFRTGEPVAIVVGAGGINAVNGQKLATELVAGGYLVTPPQPWLDGWKGTDGTVYQFVATVHKAGAGATVGEQLLGAASKTGAIGFALHVPKPGQKLVAYHKPLEGYGADFDTGLGDMHYPEGPMYMAASAGASAPMYRAVASADSAFNEMGLGKGGKIHQKIYDDPHGLSVWEPIAKVTAALYLVSAEQFAAITGQPLPAISTQETYKGPWFGVADGTHKDVPGTGAFDALKSVVSTPDPAVFPGEKK